MESSVPNHQVVDRSAVAGEPEENVLSGEFRRQRFQAYFKEVRAWAVLNPFVAGM